MENKKKVLNYCANFDKIVNCDFLEDDVLTKKLIEYYQDYVFKINEEDNNQVELIRQLDMAMFRYVEDYHFAKKLKETLNVDDDVDSIVRKDFSILEKLMRYIISVFSDYEKEVVRSIIQTKWI